MSPLAARIALPLYLAGIYGTLGVARTVTEQLRNAGFLRIAVVVAFSLAAVMAAVLILRDSLNRSPQVLAALAGTALLYGAVVFPLSSPEEKLHFIQYGLVALLAFFAMPAGWLGIKRYAAAALFTAAAGWGDEGIQALLPTRYYDLRDVGFNALAGVIALAALALLRAVRRRAAMGERAAAEA